MSKRYFDKNVYDAALDRLRFVFSEFDRVCVAFSGGKDSTVLLHLALQVAQKEFGGRPVHAMLIDLEGQYRATIEHAEEMFSLPGIVPEWICLPLNLRNASSAFAPYWCCWDPGQQEHWVRPLPDHPAVVSDQEHFPFYKFRMEFEEFVPAYNEHVAADAGAAFLVGIRADESLNRYKAVHRAATKKKCAYKDVRWSSMHTAKSRAVSFYPIYDWRFEDLWKYVWDNNLYYNRLYDQLHLAGVPFSEMRICQPYGDDQRKGLDQFHKIEPETWFRIVRRVEGANWAAHYARQKFLGYKGGLGLPPTFSSWRQYSDFLLRSLPEDLRVVYQRRIDVFFSWWAEYGFPLDMVPDVGDIRLTGKKQQPSWRRIALSLLKMDMGKSLSFGFCRKDTDRLIELQNKYADI
ncbi:MAG: DUF3440 domain-containing protein [Desulfovibrionaceae bacterium]|nr:DUF3440 domain-containing protein [Desulfovibrionaceae bacterium]